MASAKTCSGSGATYLNFLGEDGGNRVRAGFGESYERLARVKAAWDPADVFRGNHTIWPG